MDAATIFADILGAPYLLGGADPREGVDCLWTAREAIRRIFPDLSPAEMPLTDEEVGAALAGTERLPRWRLVGRTPFAGRLLGDVFHVEHSGRSSMAVLVDPDGRLALTATHERGICLVPVRGLDGVVGVWRRA